MKDKFTGYLLWIMSRTPFLKGLTAKLATKILLRIIAQSINNYTKTLDIMKSSELSGNPFWDTSCALLAIQSLLPVALIYRYAKSNEIEKAKETHK